MTCEGLSMEDSKKHYDLIVLGAKGGFLKIVFTKHDFVIRGVGNMSGHKMKISTENFV